MLVPGVVGAVLIGLFVVRVHEGDTRFDATGSERAGRLWSLGFHPREYPDFSWNWLSRFLFYFGLTFNTTFTAFYFAHRLDRSVDDVAGFFAAVAGLGLVATTCGALGAGFVSDRLRRRKGLVLGAALVFCLGGLIAGLGAGAPLLVLGFVVMTFGIGAYSAVDQALMLDLVPDRNETGRFLAIAGTATSLAQAIGPVLASVVLQLGSSGSKNYALLYVLGSTLVAGAGLVMLRLRTAQ